MAEYPIIAQEKILKNVKIEDIISEINRVFKGKLIIRGHSLIYMGKNIIGEPQAIWTVSPDRTVRIRQKITDKSDEYWFLNKQYMLLAALYKAGFIDDGKKKAVRRKLYQMEKQRGEKNE